MARVDDSRKAPFLWLHYELDDMGLSPQEFRLYVHIVRRAGKGGACWEAVGNMADHCGMSESSVKRALKVLIKKGMLDKQPRTGETSVFTIQDIEKWDLNPGHTDPGGRSERPPTQVTQTQGVGQRDLGGRSERPTKKDPSKKIQEVDPSKSQNQIFDSEFESDFWPKAFKKQSKGAAKTSYRAARKKAPKQVILEAWTLVNESVFPAKADADGTKTYIPMPSTWLNQERWEDEETVKLLEESNSPEVQIKQVHGAIRRELDRIGGNGVLPDEFRGPNQVLVSHLSLEGAQQYLVWLKQQPGRPDHAAA